MILLAATARNVNIFCDGEFVLGAVAADTERGLVFGYECDLINDETISRRDQSGGLIVFCREGKVEARDKRTGKVVS